MTDQSSDGETYHEREVIPVDHHSAQLGGLVGSQLGTLSVEVALLQAILAELQKITGALENPQYPRIE